jgi:hypothetical protein
MSMPALIMLLLIAIRLPLLSFYTICINEEAIKSVPQTEYTASTATKLMSVIVRIEAGFPHRTERLGQAEL